MASAGNLNLTAHKLSDGDGGAGHYQHISKASEMLIKRLTICELLLHRRAIGLKNKPSYLSMEQKPDFDTRHPQLFSTNRKNTANPTGSLKVMSNNSDGSRVTTWWPLDPHFGWRGKSRRAKLGSELHATCKKCTKTTSPLAGLSPGTTRPPTEPSQVLSGPKQLGWENKLGWAWWLTPVIPGLWEDEANGSSEVEFKTSLANMRQGFAKLLELVLNSWAQVILLPWPSTVLGLQA
ncbi:hypothetical protein AAY473_016493 [Plecturocebus cupreus]